MESKIQETKKPWHVSIREEERALVLSELTPENSSPRSVQMALELENSIYFKANSKAEYYALFGEQLQKLDGIQAQKDKEEVPVSMKNTIQEQPNPQNMSTSTNTSKPASPKPANPTPQEAKKEFFHYLDLTNVRYEVKLLLEDTWSPYTVFGAKSEQVRQHSAKLESLIYQKSKSRAEYFRHLADIIERVETALKKKNPKLFEEYGRLNREELWKKTQSSCCTYQGFNHCPMIPIYVWQYRSPASFASQSSGVQTASTADAGPNLESLNALLDSVNAHLFGDTEEAQKKGFEVINK